MNNSSINSADPSDHDKNRTIVPIGDDGFVFKSFNKNTALVQDMSIEGVHFNRLWSTPFDIGWKSLAVNLSDLAALGARPRYAQVSLGISAKVSDDEVLKFYGGLLTLAKKFNVDIVGGDLTASPGPWIVDISCVGEVALPVKRHNVKPRDRIFVTGVMGKSAYGLAQLKNGFVKNEFTDHHLRPSPRLDFLSILESGICSAAIDTSDGLANDLNRMSEHSATGIRLNLAMMPPVSVELNEEENLHLTLWGGEDYELILAVSPENVAQFLTATHAQGLSTFAIGEFTEGREFLIERKNGDRQNLTESKSWKHF